MKITDVPTVKFTYIPADAITKLIPYQLNLIQLITPYDGVDYKKKLEPITSVLGESYQVIGVSELPDYDLAEIAKSSLRYFIFLSQTGEVSRTKALKIRDAFNESNTTPIIVTFHRDKKSLFNYKVNQAVFIAQEVVQSIPGDTDHLMLLKGKGIGGAQVIDNWMRDEQINPITGLIC